MVVALGVGAEGALHARAPRRRTSEARSWLGQAHVPVACFGVPSRVGALAPTPSATHWVVQRFLSAIKFGTALALGLARYLPGHGRGRGVVVRIDGSWGRH